MLHKIIEKCAPLKVCLWPFDFPILNKRISTLNFERKYLFLIFFLEFFCRFTFIWNDHYWKQYEFGYDILRQEEFFRPVNNNRDRFVLSPFLIKNPSRKDAIARCIDSWKFLSSQSHCILYITVQELFLCRQEYLKSVNIA